MKTNFIIAILTVALLSAKSNAQSNIAVTEATVETSDWKVEIVNKIHLNENDGIITIQNKSGKTPTVLTIKDEQFNLLAVLPSTHIYVLHDALLFRNEILIEIRGIGKEMEPESLYAIKVDLAGKIDCTYGNNGLLNISQHIRLVEEVGFVYTVCPRMFTDNEGIYLEKGNMLQRCDSRFNIDYSFGNFGKVDITNPYGASLAEISFTSDQVLCKTFSPMVDYECKQMISKTGELEGTVYTEKE